MISDTPSVDNPGNVNHRTIIIQRISEIYAGRPAHFPIHGLCHVYILNGPPRKSVLSFILYPIYYYAKGIIRPTSRYPPFSRDFPSSPGFRCTMTSHTDISEGDLEKTTPTKTSLADEDRGGNPSAVGGEGDVENKDVEKGSAPVCGVDPFIVGWDGDDDPANPLNWPDSKKWFNMSIVSAITFITYVISREKYF